MKKKMSTNAKERLYREVNCKDRMPPDGSHYDYPPEYIFIGKHEDPRGPIIVEALDYAGGVEFVKDFEFGRSWWLERVQN